MHAKRNVLAYSISTMISLTLYPPVTTSVLCLSLRLRMFLRSIYCKQYDPRSDCSQGSLAGNEFKLEIVQSMGLGFLKSVDVFTQVHANYYCGQ